MSSDLPEGIFEFGKFLEEKGLVFDGYEEISPNPCNEVLLRYSNADLMIRISSDRRVWMVEIAEKNLDPSRWWGSKTLLGLLSGTMDEAFAPMTLAEQFDFFRSNWEIILPHFSPERALASHERLRVLLRDWWQKQIPTGQTRSVL